MISTRHAAGSQRKTRRNSGGCWRIAAGGRKILAEPWAIQNSGEEVRQALDSLAETGAALVLTAEGSDASAVRMERLPFQASGRGMIPGASPDGAEAGDGAAESITLREALSSPDMQNEKSPTAIALGRDTAGRLVILELMALPHLLVSGEIGGGKTVLLNNIICTVLRRAAPKTSACCSSTPGDRGALPPDCHAIAPGSSR